MFVAADGDLDLWLADTDFPQVVHGDVVDFAGDVVLKLLLIHCLHRADGEEFLTGRHRDAAHQRRVVLEVCNLFINDWVVKYHERAAKVQQTILGETKLLGTSC
jgi:hypothetical protein